MYKDTLSSKAAPVTEESLSSLSMPALFKRVEASLDLVIEGRVGFLGFGSYGTAIGAEVCRAGNNDVIGYVRSLEKANEINFHSTNSKYFAKTPLPASLGATTDIEHLIKTSETLVIAVPSRELSNIIQEIKRVGLPEESTIVTLIKGFVFEGDSVSTPGEYIKRELGNNVRVGTLSGPSFASEMVQSVLHDIPLEAMELVAAAEDPEVARHIIDTFCNDRLFISGTIDHRGVELASAYKNVIAMGLGLIHDRSSNTRASVFKLGVSELSNFLSHLGCEQQTAFGSAGMADAYLSASEKSRNYVVGKMLLEGKSMVEIQGSSTTLEGIRTVEAFKSLADQAGLYAPFTNLIHDIISAEIPAEDMVERYREVRLDYMKSQRSVIGGAREFQHHSFPFQLASIR